MNQNIVNIYYTHKNNKKEFIFINLCKIDLLSNNA